MMVTSCRALAVVMAALAAQPAHAQGKAPWSEGVTDEQKARAKVLLDAGNALLIEKKYVEALDKYTQAVAVWDHPAIRFNMVRCLIQLGRNLEAHDNLEKSLKYGAAPLEETVYNEAIAYQKLLASQVGDIEVSCDQAGVTLTLDGQPLASCPTKQTTRVLSGAHQIVGTKQGLLPKTVEFVVKGGETKPVDVHLDPLAKGAKVVHRWPTYVPWSVFGGGLAVAGIGVAVYAFGNSQMNSYDAWVDDNCTGNCPDAMVPEYVRDDKEGAELKNNIGVSMMVTGGAAVAAGAVMLYLNRGRTVYPEVRVTAEGAAVSWTGRF